VSKLMSEFGPGPKQPPVVRFGDVARRMNVEPGYYPSCRDPEVLKAMGELGYTVVRDKLNRNSAARYVDPQGRAYCLQTYDAIRNDLADQLTQVNWGRCRGESE
jgi:hypothetical protein